MLLFFFFPLLLCWNIASFFRCYENALFMGQIRLWEADLNRVEMTPAHYYDEFPSRVIIQLVGMIYSAYIRIIKIKSHIFLLPSSRKFLRVLVTMHGSGMVCCGRTRRRCVWQSRQKSTRICENTLAVRSSRRTLSTFSSFKMNKFGERPELKNDHYIVYSGVVPGLAGVTLSDLVQSTENNRERISGKFVQRSTCCTKNS